MENKIRDLRQEIFKFEQLSNFDKNDFVPGKCAQSHISHLNFTIFCNEEDSFTLLCVSSFSNYLLDWLMDASTEHGYVYTNFNLQKEK